jgi:preprotein translocase subunit SecG
MENVILVVHLILALSLIGIVLLQRSEGGGLGIGGGGGAATGRATMSPMAIITWVLAVGFIATSITLTIVAAQNSAGSSVLDRIVDAPAPTDDNALDLPSGDSLLPPADSDAPLTPPRADE